jgi:dCMP deaminase
MALDIEPLVDLAIATAQKSPSRPRKVGAVLVLEPGATTLAACNDFPAGVRDLEARHAHPDRLLWIEHAERNVIFAAARAGLSTAGATLVVTFHPCADCARAIVQSGITTLHTDFADPPIRPFAARVPSSKRVGCGGLPRTRSGLMHALTLGA